MRVFILFLLSFLLSSPMIFAEPLILQQADNTLSPKTLEVGISDILYENDFIKFVDDNGNTLSEVTYTSFITPLYLKYAFSSTLEAGISIPFVSLNSKTEVGGVSTKTDDSGLGDPYLLVKKNLLNDDWKFGIGASVSIPVGEKKFREGFNFEPILALRRDLGDFIINMNLSYNITGEYKEDSTDTKQNPGDIYSGGIGIEIPMKSLKGLDILGEFVYRGFSEASIEGVSQDGTSGSQSDLVLGFNYSFGKFKTKLGLTLALGEEKYRSYDYRIQTGITYLIGL